MKPDHLVIFSTRPIAVGEMLDAQKVSTGDVAAMVRLFVSRSNVTEEEMLRLDGDELEELAKAFNESIKRSKELQQLGRMLDESND